MRIQSFANFVLAAGGTLILYVLSHFLTISPLTRQQQFNSYTAWIALCIALACVAAFLFASLRFTTVHKIAVAGLFVSLAAVLYGAEIVIASSGLGSRTTDQPFWSIDRASTESRAQIARLARGFGVRIDTRDQTEMLTELRKRHVDAVPAVMLGPMLEERHVLSSDSATNNELMPLGGLANKLTVLCNESGSYVKYESDEHGFRNPKGIWKSARTDLAAVGQSLTQGYCVPDGKIFVDLLRNDYPVTLNLGISGQGSLLQLAAIKEYLRPQAPKTVLWVFAEGIDLSDLYDESRHPFLMRYTETSFTQHLIARQSEVDDVLRHFVDETEIRARERRVTTWRSTLIQESLELVKLWHLREAISSLYGTDSSYEHGLSMVTSTEHNLLGDALQQANTITRSWGGTLYFVYLPSWNRYANGPEACRCEIERTTVLALVKTLGIPIIDVHLAFNAHRDPLSLFPFRRFGHYNEQGNQIVAETVRNALSRHAEHDNLISASGYGAAQ